MPPAIYAFSLCAFAFGFVEFIAIGLAPAMAEGIGVPVEDLGAAVTAYALGVAVGAPVLTALTTHWSRRTLLAAAMVIFVIGNTLISISGSLPTILGARFATGLMHGVFLAVASSVAEALVPKNRSASAIAFVFGGLTVALVTGVPAGTYLGSILGWRFAFAGIAAFGMISVIALWMLTPKGTGDEVKAEKSGRLAGLFNPALLKAAGIAVLSYGGAFTIYTYATPFLQETTGLSIGVVSTVLLGYGLAAALGNIVGGALADKIGSQKASVLFMAGLTVVLVLIGIFSSLEVPTIALFAALGFLMFGAVPVLQARIIRVADAQEENLSAAASGMNIAGFNIGITFGSIVGHAVISLIGLPATPFVGAVVTALGFAFLVLGGRAEHELRTSH